LLILEETTAESVKFVRCSFPRKQGAGMETEFEKRITTCPSCQSRYRVSGSLEGKSVSCKKCGKQFPLLFEKTTPPNISEPTVDGPKEPMSYSPVGTQSAFGKLALKSEVITKEQLIEAYLSQKKQKEAGRDIHLGEILVEKEMISQQQLESLLKAQSFSETRTRDGLFGEIAVQMGFAKQSDVDTAMEAQARLFEASKSVARLADIMVGDGVITDDQHYAILSAQNRLNRPAHGGQAGPEASEPDDAGVSSQSVPFELAVSDDKLAVFVRTANGDASGITLEAIKEQLRSHGIKHNVLSDEQILENLKIESLHSGDWLVTRGTPPKPGRDEEIKYNFETDPLKVGTEKEGGVIDFKDRGAIPYVKQGELVAEKIPGVEGVHGMDVYGEVVPAPKIKKAKFLAGRGIEKSEDNLKFFAKADGRPSLSLDGRIGVRPEITVSGDIGYDTGHVDFDGHIDVSGAVQDGFRVKARGLRASEILKSDVEVSGDIVVNGGIIGANIRTKGNLQAKYARGATIESLGNVLIRKEIYDCDIRTSSACVVENGRIISSRISAKKGIRSVDVGSDGSNPCKLIVGIDEVTEKEIEGINEKIAQWEVHKKGPATMVDNIKVEFERLGTQIGKLSRVLEDQTKQLETLEKVIEELKSQNNPSQSAKVQEVAESLNSKIHQITAALETLSIEEGQLAVQMATHIEEIQRTDEVLQRLWDRKESVVEWSKKEPKVPAVTVSGTIYAQSLIEGPNSAIKLKNNERHTVIRETLVDQEEDAPKRWHFDIGIMD